jgi:hypothetical protein
VNVAVFAFTANFAFITFVFNVFVWIFPLLSKTNSSEQCPYRSCLLVGALISMCWDVIVSTICINLNTPWKSWTRSTGQAWASEYPPWDGGVRWGTICIRIHQLIMGLSIWIDRPGLQDRTRLSLPMANASKQYPLRSLSAPSCVSTIWHTIRFGLAFVPCTPDGCGSVTMYNTKTWSSAGGRMRLSISPE